MPELVRRYAWPDVQEPEVPPLLKAIAGPMGRTSFTDFWRWFTSPFQWIQGVGQRHQARFFTELSLGMIVFGLLFLLIQAMVAPPPPWHATQVRLMLGALVINLFLYLFSSTRHQNLAAGAAIALASAVPFLVAWPLSQPYQVAALYFLVLPVVFSSIFYRSLVAIAVASANMAGVLALAWLLPGALRAQVLTGPLLFLALSVPFVLVAARYYRHMELYHVRQIEGHEAHLRRAVADTRSRLKEQTILRRASTIVSTTLELEEVLRLIAEQMGFAMDASSVRLYPLQPGPTGDAPPADYFSDRATPAERTVPADAATLEPLLAEAAGLLETQEVLTLAREQSGLTDLQRAYLQHHDLAVAMVLPIRLDGTLIALAIIGDSRPRRDFSREDLGLGLSLAQLAAVAIRNARLYRQAQQEIAERKQAESQLRKVASELEQQTRMLDTVFASTPDHYYVLDRSGHFLYVNPPVLRFLRRQAEEVLGKSWRDLGFPAAACEVFERQMAQALAQETAIAGELQYDFRDRAYWVESIFIPVQGEQGTAQTVVAAMRDISERKRSEELLRQAHKMESLGIMASGIAHDFNNLLAAVLGQNSLALMKLSQEEPARAHVEKANRAAEQAARLTQQMLAYSGRGSFSLSVLDLNGLIRQHSSTFQAALPPQAKLEMDLAPDLPPIHADATQIQQLLMNLILNAGEAIGQEHGRVAVRTRTVALQAGELPHPLYAGENLAPGQYVRLTVEDDGCGMDAETLTRIFDPFFTTKFTGRGLGLAVVLGIVQGHQAGIQVHSEVGVGTTFHIYFTVADEIPGYLRSFLDPEDHRGDT